MKQRKDTSFTRFLVREFRRWEDDHGGKSNVSEWARYLGVKQPTLNRWINGDTTPDAAGVAVLVARLGNGVYDALGIEPPDQISVSGLPDDFRRKLEAATVEARNAVNSSGLDPDSSAAWALVAEAFSRHGLEFVLIEAK